METIIGLLMILLPVAFKLIGKRLEQAEKQQPQVTVSEETPAVVETAVPEPMSMDSVEVKAPARTRKPKQQKKVVKKAPILLEEEKKPKEKIDVKKLIVYSEIMKPKYTE